jgi:hypothetical protein
VLPGLVRRHLEAVPNRIQVEPTGRPVDRHFRFRDMRPRLREDPRCLERGKGSLETDNSLNRVIGVNPRAARTCLTPMA